jgi:hypothetical protein
MTGIIECMRNLCAAQILRYRRLLIEICEIMRGVPKTYDLILLKKT